MNVYLFVTLAKDFDLDTFLGKLIRNGYSPASAEPDGKFATRGVLALRLETKTSGPWGAAALDVAKVALHEMNVGYHSIVVYVSTELTWSNGNISQEPAKPTRFDRVQNE